MPGKTQRGKNQHSGDTTDPNRKSTVNQPADQTPPEETNETHPSARGVLDSAPGVGVVGSEADIGTHEGGPGRNAPDARVSAPGARRPGTTEGRGARAGRHGGQSGLERIEAPTTQGQTAYSGPTGGTGAPSPGSSGIRATSDPNFTAQRADEEGTPSPEALAEQRASLGKKNPQKPGSDHGQKNKS